MKKPSLNLNFFLTLIADSRSKQSHNPTADQIIDLSYYQSHLANDPHSRPHSVSPVKSSLRSSATRAASPSSSEYSCDSDNPTSSRPHPRSKHSKRSSTLSDVGQDRRRLAIVQIETVKDGRSKSSSDHGHGSVTRSKRGTEPNLEGLALVSPPDVSPSIYAHLTPPLPSVTPEEVTSPNSDKKHTKLSSDGKSSHELSTRDNFVTSIRQHMSQPPPPPPSADEKTLRHTSFQSQPRETITSAPPSTSTSSAGHLNLHSSGSSTSVNLHSPSVDQPIVTPPLEHSKDITTPVAAPVVVNLQPSKPLNVNKSRGGRDETPAPQIIVQSASNSSDTHNDSYLHYQPGLHATAGPLPPPPRATFAIDPTTPPPPRPPRLTSPQPRNRGDVEAVKQALQLPPSVSAALASRSPKSQPPPPEAIDNIKIPPPSPSTLPTVSLITKPPSSSDDKLDSIETMPFHRREGAFMPTPDPSISTNSSEQLIPSSLLAQEPVHDILVPVPEDDVVEESHELQENEQSTVYMTLQKAGIISPPPRTDSLTQHISADQDTAFASVARASTPLLEKHTSGFPSADLSSTPPDHIIQTPSPPPKSFRNSLTTNLKRLSSLPRTPSLSSRSGKRSSIDTRRSSRTPSPSCHHQPDSMAPSQRQKIISRNPPAMYCHEVYSCKSAMERCEIYARKINELYNYDTGLSDWLYEAKSRGSNASPNNNNPSSPIIDPFTPQRRHTSGSSMMTEATFPRRPDATTATDLTNVQRNITPPTSQPPPLPYPSLAIPQQQRTPRPPSNVGNHTPTTSIRSLAPATPTSSSKTGFFAVLGRKASVSGRREKPVLNALLPPVQQPQQQLHQQPQQTQQQQQAQQSSPRPVNITSSPSVPGGPRAPPNRAKRSQTLMSSVKPFSPKSQAEHNDQITRRPSMVNLPVAGTGGDAPPEPDVIDIKMDPEFSRQVDRLADLLPHADRNILAAYLRHAGQDILAIGQYLDDEKNGTLRTD
ncbi:hypothetical protein AMATHDRAFT_2028 [Amanita thiersii Skay4041]|uniref:CUE domain-containing protein n=1 Tax=Amanita thiersii Skay4041 TaxID=703135 RepID=A0A2A9NXT9_9AGAR|nr:hypothetical protein AMATHDRAFT_2028 [Amanita thiersii Skay4041]